MARSEVKPGEKGGAMVRFPQAAGSASNESARPDDTITQIVWQLRLPLLDKVSHPVAVDPDTTLRAYAEKNGWPIISLR